MFATRLIKALSGFCRLHTSSFRRKEALLAIKRLSVLCQRSDIFGLPERTEPLVSTEISARTELCLRNPPRISLSDRLTVSLWGWLNPAALARSSPILPAARQSRTGGRHGDTSHRRSTD